MLINLLLYGLFRGNERESRREWWRERGRGRGRERELERERERERREEKKKVKSDYLTIQDKLTQELLAAVDEGELAAVTKLLNNPEVSVNVTNKVKTRDR